jgi:hypothetical protein
MLFDYFKLFIQLLNYLFLIIKNLYFEMYLLNILYNLDL